MTSLKTILAAGAFATVVAAGAFAAATPASAEVACNRWGDCWHVNNRIAYPRAARVVFHDDSWRAAHAAEARYHWREERAEHGYWRNGIWIKF